MALQAAKLAAKVVAGGRPRGRVRLKPDVVTALSVALAVAAVGCSPSFAAVAAPAAPVGRGNTCLRRLVTHPAEFAACRTGSICFLFIEEDPFIVIGDVTNAETRLNPRTPFPCTAYAERNVFGNDTRTPGHPGQGHALAVTGARSSIRPTAGGWAFHRTVSWSTRC